MINWCLLAYKRNDTIPLALISMIFLSLANNEQTKKYWEREKNKKNHSVYGTDNSSMEKKEQHPIQKYFQKISAFSCCSSVAIFFFVYVIYCLDTHMVLYTYAIVSIVVIWRECLCTLNFQNNGNARKKSEITLALLSHFHHHH